MRNIAYSLALIYINTAARFNYDLPDFLQIFGNKDNCNISPFFLKIIEYCASEVKNRNVVLDH